MKTHNATLSVGLLVAATACGDILGIDDNSVSVICFADKDCERPLVCREQKCVALGGTAGSAGTSHGGSGGLFATSGGTTGSGGSSIVPVSGGTGGVSITTGGLAGTTAGEGGTESIGGTGGTVATGGAQTVGGDVGTGGSTAIVGGGGIAGYGGALPSGGTGGTSGATTSVAGMTQGGAGGHIVTGGTAGVGAAGAGAVGNNGGVSGGGTGGVAGIAGGVRCARGDHRCFEYDNEGHSVAWQTCDPAGNWGGDVPCPGHCRPREKDGCVVARSCVGINDCYQNHSCCNSLPLPGDTFDRSNENVETCTTTNPCRATLSPFLLDTFEVTVARFRNFVKDYENFKPINGDGKNANNPTDPGWNENWNSSLPTSQALLVQQLQSCSDFTYTTALSVNDFKPINCVNWYLAFAFCIWDDARLPTEAEWNYAASGGENRYFPWSRPYYDRTYSHEHAIFTDVLFTPLGPDFAGTAYKGISKWGQLDLAGNVFELLADAYHSVYPDPFNCVNCANTNWSSNTLRVLRGGCYLTDQTYLSVSFRMSGEAAESGSWLGFRCARDF